METTHLNTYMCLSSVQLLFRMTNIRLLVINGRGGCYDRRNIGIWWPYFATISGNISSARISTRRTGLLCSMIDASQ